MEDFDQRGYPRRDSRHHQKVLNERWPLIDSKGHPHARGIPDQPKPIPVRARVVWEGDGEEWVDGMARRWSRNAVFRWLLTTNGCRRSGSGSARSTYNGAKAVRRRRSLDVMGFGW